MHYQSLLFLEKFRGTFSLWIFIQTFASMQEYPLSFPELLKRNEVQPS
jgi:hypothetical protein